MALLQSATAPFSVYSSLPSAYFSSLWLTLVHPANILSLSPIPVRTELYACNCWVIKVWGGGYLDELVMPIAQACHFLFASSGSGLLPPFLCRNYCSSLGGTSLDPIFMRKLGQKWKKSLLSTLEPTIFLGLKWKCNWV